MSDIFVWITTLVLGVVITIIATEPIALQLRFLQTLTEIASEKNSTTIFPVPIDLLKPFLNQGIKIALEE